MRGYSLSSLSSCSEMWVAKDEYDESGLDIYRSHKMLLNINVQHNNQNTMKSKYVIVTFCFLQFCYDPL